MRFKYINQVVFISFWGEQLLEEAAAYVMLITGKACEDLKPEELTVAAIGILYRRNLIQKPEQPNTSPV